MNDPTNPPGSLLGQSTAEETRLREIEYALIHHTRKSHEDAIALIKERIDLQRKLRGSPPPTKAPAATSDEGMRETEDFSNSGPCSVDGQPTNERAKENTGKDSSTLSVKAAFDRLSDAKAQADSEKEYADVELINFIIAHADQLRAPRGEQ